jgi:long-subunit acyl-CoA synthetase (AMP-forming)
VQLTHRNLITCAKVVQGMVRLPEGARVISWLPAAHIAERAAHHYLPIVFGFTVTCCPNPREVVAYLPQVRPNWFLAVPRIWEKIKAGLEARLAPLPDEQRTRIEHALTAARDKVRREQAGQPLPPALAAQVA